MFQIFVNNVSILSFPVKVKFELVILLSIHTQRPSEPNFFNLFQVKVKKTFTFKRVKTGIAIKNRLHLVIIRRG